jgi:hypothetical protein
MAGSNRFTEYVFIPAIARLAKARKVKNILFICAPL